MQKTIIKKPKCKECGSQQVYYRQKTKDQVCRICGHVEEPRRAER